MILVFSFIFITFYIYRADFRITVGGFGRSEGEAHIPLLDDVKGEPQ